MQKSRAPLHPGQPLVHSETHCAVYVTTKFKEFFGEIKAESTLLYLRSHGWSFCEIYQMTRHNQLIYDATRQVLALHDYLTASGIDRPLVKKILCSRILPQTTDPATLVVTIKHLISYGITQQQLCELIRKKPRILLLTREQIDTCRRSSLANDTSFTYYLRKATTASAQCPNRRPAANNQRTRASSPSPAISI